ncbi:MAG: hypothetical protein H6712_15785 [Myxococcales bacterium]|nr:hypothetical protein [Myxococcales bacterium]MCB9715328.1 hypothetical protein [Myxococcales bacterium]
MSSAEIADNKWELSSTKPPLNTAGGVMQLLLMVGFVSLFGWLIGSSIIGIVTEKEEDGGLAGQYKNMGVEGTAEKKAEE